MYYYKLFTWKNGKKDIDLTKYLLAPIFLEDRLNEELSTGEVILDAIPRELYTKPFAPKTKMRIERYRDKECKDKLKHWDMVVEHDDIEEYVGCPQYLCHRVHLIEPSVIAQGMHVDNIALTYELQDVTTEYKTYRIDTTKVKTDIQNAGHEKAIYEVRSELIDFGLFFISEGTFKNSYRYEWDKNDITKLENALQKEYNAKDHHPIEFDIPRLYCYGATDSAGFDKKLFQLPVVVTIKIFETQNDILISDIPLQIITKYGGPAEITPANDDWYYSDGKIAALRILNENKKQPGVFVADGWYAQAPIISQIGKYDTKVTFTIPSLNNEELNAKLGYKYVIKINANPVNAKGMLTHYEIGFSGSPAVGGGSGDFHSKICYKKGCKI